MSNLKNKVFSGLIWTYAERFFAQIISLLVTVILARIIAPEEYGIIAIISVFITIADSFAINGLGNSLIQKKNADELDFSSVFYFNIFFSIIIYIIFWIFAVPLAKFYNEQLLCPVLRVMAIRIPIAAINSVQQAYVSKRMEFRKFFFATIIGTVISAIVGIAMAYLGYGVWALVAQYLINTFIDTIILWLTVKWRPRFIYSWERMKGLFSYGWKVLATSLLITIYSNIQDLIIGKKFSSVDLAYCNKGRQFPSLISTNINTSITKVLFPAISECQDDRYRVKQMTRKSISIGTYILAPVLIGLAAIGDGFIEIILTDKWSGCVPFLRIMCLVYLLQPIQTSSIQAMKAIGKSDLYLKLEIQKKIFGIGVLAVTVLFFNSVFVIIVGSLIAEIFSTILNIPYMEKLIDYKVAEQINDIFPSLLMAFIMFLTVYPIHYIKINIWIKLGLQILIGISIYITISCISKNTNYQYVKKILSTYLKRKKG